MTGRRCGDRARLRETLKQTVERDERRRPPCLAPVLAGGAHALASKLMVSKTAVR
jgi:hypothetical protein